MNRKWVVKTPDDATIRQLAEEGQFSIEFSTILVNRTIKTLGDFKRFISTDLHELKDPKLFHDSDKIAGRIIEAIRHHEKIAIHGDYDVDGIAATAILYLFLKDVGADVIYFIPDRLHDGYGLKVTSIDELMKQDVKIIITVDCGMTACDEARYAKEKNVTLMITDHHDPVESHIPDAFGIMNPKHMDRDFFNDELCGAGVAFYLMIALRKQLMDSGFFDGREIPNLKAYLDLVALGTIADVSPIIGINRILIYHGLKLLTHSERPGIHALKQVSGLSDKPMTPSHVGFQLAPRLNAAGRLSDATRSLELLMSRDLNESIQIAQLLHLENTKRQMIEKRILDEAVAMIETSDFLKKRSCIVLASNGWHEGVIGIVASRLVEKYYKPTILISFNQDGVGKGSGRSIRGIHLMDVLTYCEPALMSFGGHAYAAGLNIEEQKLELFLNTIEEYVSSRYSRDIFDRVMEIDCEIDFQQITQTFVEELNTLAPYGPGHAEPIFQTTHVRVIDSRVMKDTHLKLTLEKNGVCIQAIGFKMAEYQTELTPLIDIAFYPEFNNYKDRQTIQLRLKDIKRRGS